MYCPIQVPCSLLWYTSCPSHIRSDSLRFILLEIYGILFFQFLKSRLNRNFHVSIKKIFPPKNLYRDVTSKKRTSSFQTSRLSAYSSSSSDSDSASAVSTLASAASAGSLIFFRIFASSSSLISPGTATGSTVFLPVFLRIFQK